MFRRPQRLPSQSCLPRMKQRKVRRTICGFQMLDRRNILAFLLTASVLLVGIVSSTHHHLPPAACDVGGFDSVAAHQHDACGHHCHPLNSDSPQHSDSAPCDHDHDDDCQICRLLVDFCATPVLNFQLVLDSIVEPARQLAPASVVASTTLRVRSRAPPIV